TLSADGVSVGSSVVASSLSSTLSVTGVSVGSSVVASLLSSGFSTDVVSVCSSFIASSLSSYLSFTAVFVGSSLVTSVSSTSAVVSFSSSSASSGPCAAVASCFGASLSSTLSVAGVSVASALVASLSSTLSGTGVSVVVVSLLISLSFDVFSAGSATGGTSSLVVFSVAFSAVTLFILPLSVMCVVLLVVVSSACASFSCPKKISEPMIIEAVPTVNFLIEYLFNRLGMKSNLLEFGFFFIIIFSFHCYIFINRC